MSGMLHIRHLAPILVVVLTAGAAAYGLRWLQQQPCTRLVTRNMIQTDSASIHRLAMPADSTFKAAIVADRVRRHPWVRWSTATCYPTGALHLNIEERVPVLLVIDEAGHSAHFIDPGGFMMPLTGHSTFDVPLLRGLSEPYHPIKPVSHPEVRALAQALARVEAGTKQLLSEFMVTHAGIALYTVTAANGTPVEVWLGREDFALRLQRFRFFWEQHMVRHPWQSFDLIDLRFKGQIVTREAST